ncbi:MAG: hypothetical protein RBR47_08335 [Bacteroidales bacterium]|jgi:hypothetical protein|nr:hypothetical protein [Bacteroidales bacterium]MDD3525849.1 hypothetical protein [Bacteroidales bacterium]MDD4176397.1 hypothetical protein [Bacteroidales bacterium]MDD4740837.1 hypothetical protein [Bacteroidales bacterium]MDY0334954.1 hypothetical protein [Bacteroidales bacterium]
MIYACPAVISVVVVVMVVELVETSLSKELMNTIEDLNFRN